MTANSTPCSPWTTDELVRACCGGLDPDYDLTSAIQFASEILFRLSGRQFPGVCTQTVWPCQGVSCSGFEDPTWGHFTASGWHFAQRNYGFRSNGFEPGYGAGYPSIPYPAGDGGWSNCWDCGSGISSGICGGGCYLPWVVVPGPIVSIHEIVVNGQLLPSSSYVVDNKRKIGRVDGGTWPCSNDLYNTTVAVDPSFSIAVNGDGGTWDLDVDVEGNVTSFTFDVADDASTIQATLAVAYGSGNVSVSGGPADVGGTTPFTITFDVFSLSPTISLTADATNLLDGVDPGSAAVLVIEEGAIPGDGAWYITYDFGKPVPPGGVFAASIFACQIALSRCGSDNCVLPARLKEITREDVQMAFADPLEFIGKGEVGIYEVDLWLNSVNPKKIQRRASVYRADAPPAPKRFS